MSSPPIASISVVIPALDAGRIIDGCLDAVLSQHDCPPFDVWVAVGPSADDTLARVEARGAADPRVHAVDNPSGRTPSALNAAIAASAGDLVVRVDAQARIPAGYLAALATASSETGAANVGGRQVPVGRDAGSTAIAVAMASPFGAGPAAFRSGGQAGPVDTVYLGAFRRDALLDVGGYDDSLIRNQDYELNWRLREAGHTVWLDPSIAVEYEPRASLEVLASQYWQYGLWKRRVLRAHPRSARPRQLAAPALVLGLLASLVAGWFVSTAAFLGPLFYVLAVIFAANRSSGASKQRVAAAFITMHLAWGTGFLIGR